jgi:hypothetical protein
MQSKLPSLTVLPFASLLLLTSSCTIHGGCSGPSGYYVNGVHLAEMHTEVLAAPTLPADGLWLEIGAGDVRVESTTGAPSVEVVVHEKTKGDASVRFEGGRLVVTTDSGAPAALGDVIVRSNAPLARASIETGAGDVSLDGVDVQSGLSVETGAGDVRVRALKIGGQFEIASGAGDVRVESVECGDIGLSSGAGDFALFAVHGRIAKLDTGVGDLELQDCRFSEIEANSGVGDMRLVDCSYEKSDFDSGLGDVTIRSGADAEH